MIGISCVVRCCAELWDVLFQLHPAYPLVSWLAIRNVNSLRAVDVMNES